jgi:putative transposase
MTDIVALVHCLAPLLSPTNLRQLRHLIFALLCIPNRATMLGLSRWTERGGSYRTLQRWYHTPLDWAALLWAVVRVHLLDPGGIYLLAGDEVVVSKAGKTTHGLGRFYSSLAQHPISSVAFLAVSLIDVQRRRSYPLQVEQRLPPEPVAQATGPAPKRPRGRPKGSKNHVKAAPTLTPELTLLQRLLQAIIARIAPLKVKHVVLDGFFGTYPATCMVLDCGLQLISKLRHNAALYLPYSGPKSKRGPTPRYGNKLDYRNLPAAALGTTVTEGAVRTERYHLTALHHDFPDPLNIVVLVKTNLRTHQRAHVVLFSTDLDLSAAQIVDYYGLRFQIEFNFRDAKQYWGLEDFMNVTPTAVTNAANLAFLMVNVSAVLLKPYRQQHPDFSILDLKTHFRARRYLDETIKCLPDPPDDDLISRIWRRLTRLGGIRAGEIDPYAA